jgi:hypothetical protein
MAWHYRVIIVVGVAALLAFPSLEARGAPVEITFDNIPALTPVQLVPGETLDVSGGFTLRPTASLGNDPVVVIDTGDTPPNIGVAGDLASQICFAGLCATNFTQAAFVFRSGGFSLSYIGNAPFSLSQFDAAIAGNALSRATRFDLTGMVGTDVVKSESFLLLPAGYSPYPGETVPADAAPGPDEYFQTLSVSGFTNITSLQFSLALDLGTDPLSVMDFGFLPEYVIDNIHLDVSGGPQPPVATPEPATFAIVLTGIAGMAALRRRREI